MQRQLASHEILEGRTAQAYRPYDRLILRNADGRTIWTVLACKPDSETWKVTAIRCPPRCPMHHRKR
jgi:hypothetical protein